MGGQRHERYGVWDNFVRGCYFVLCLFANVAVAGQVWVDTRATWGGAGAAAALAVLVLLVIGEIWLYFLLWHDARISVTEANVSPTIVKSQGDPVRIEILVHNDGMREARGVALEAIVDGESVGMTSVDIARDGIKSVAIQWAARKGEHDLRIRAEPGAAKGARGRFWRRSTGVELFAGDFSIRLGRAVAKQKDLVETAAKDADRPAGP
jgi:hypothetical protein